MSGLAEDVECAHRHCETGECRDHRRQADARKRSVAQGRIAREDTLISHVTLDLRDRPNARDTPLRRTIAASRWPSHYSITSFHGTK
jgi:hypothetical protein